MAFGICPVRDKHGMDALPVAKVTHYPLEERDYRPFAQNILCIGGGCFILRMWAFEVSPLPGSELRAVLYPFAEEPSRSLHIRSAIAGESTGTPEFEAFIVDSQGGTEPVNADFRAYSGEDLQGVYWGAEASVSFEELKKIGGKLLLSPGSRIPGNFYKVRETGENQHFGSYFPADWDNPYGRESMDEFEILNY